MATVTKNGTLSILDITTTNLANIQSAGVSVVVESISLALTVNYDAGCFAKPVVTGGELLTAFTAQEDSTAPGVINYTASYNTAPALNSGRLLSVTFNGSKDCSDAITSSTSVILTKEIQQKAAFTKTVQPIPVTFK